MRYLERTLPTLAENLALDEALLVDAEEKSSGPILRLWELPCLAVVLGASGRRLDDVKVDLCERDGVTIGRRSSGGGTVVIGPGALNVAVVLPIAEAPELTGIESAQHFVLSRMAESIRRGGSAVEVLGSGDLVLAGRKVSGSAQRRLRRSVLIHATILYEFPLRCIEAYTRDPKRQPAYRQHRPHDEFVTNLPLDRLSLSHAIRSAWIDPTEPVELAGVPEGLVKSLVADKFGDPAWVERF